MHPLTFVSANWQKGLPILAAIGALFWVILFRDDPSREQAIFAALLVIYMVHQIEEHLWPGGFRQFGNAHVFHSGRDDWPITEGGVALVNIGLVWLPVVLAMLFPENLRWLGLAWIGVTLVNAITHIVALVRLKSYNPGLVTAVVLFLPFTIWVLVREMSAGALSGRQILLILIAGVLLHVPVAAIFVIPYLRARDRVGPSRA